MVSVFHELYVFNDISLKTKFFIVRFVDEPDKIHHKEHKKHELEKIYVLTEIIKRSSSDVFVSILEWIQGTEWKDNSEVHTDHRMKSDAACSIHAKKYRFSFYLGFSSHSQSTL